MSWSSPSPRTGGTLHKTSIGEVRLEYYASNIAKRVLRPSARSG
jgi:hypothetical protein